MPIGQQFPSCCSAQILSSFPYYDTEGGYQYQKPPTDAVLTQEILLAETTHAGPLRMVILARKTQHGAEKALIAAGYVKVGTALSSHGGGETIDLYCKGLKEFKGKRAKFKKPRPPKLVKLKRSGILRRGQRYAD